MGAKTSRGLQIKQHFRKNMVPDFGYNCKKRHFFHFFCPGAKLSGAKLSWCQIVLVPNCPGAKLSTFIILVPNCLLLLSWCQIVRCQIVRCQIVRCQIVLQSKSGTIFFISNIYIPKMKNKKKRSFILLRTQIGFNLKCIAQCICSKSSGLTFLDNVWFGMFEMKNM